MWQDEDEFVIKCQCGSLDHLVRLHFWASPYLVETREKERMEHLDLDIFTQASDWNFMRRLKNAFLYIFKNRKFWHWGETNLNLLDDRGISELEGLIDFLQSKLEKAKELKKKFGVN